MLIRGIYQHLLLEKEQYKNSTLWEGCQVLLDGTSVVSSDAHQPTSGRGGASASSLCHMFSSPYFMHEKLSRVSRVSTQQFSNFLIDAPPGFATIAPGRNGFVIVCYRLEAFKWKTGDGNMI